MLQYSVVIVVTILHMPCQTKPVLFYLRADSLCLRNSHKYPLGLPAYFISALVTVMDSESEPEVISITPPPEKRPKLNHELQERLRLELWEFWIHEGWVTERGIKMPSLNSSPKEQLPKISLKRSRASEDLGEAAMD